MSPSPFKSHAAPDHDRVCARPLFKSLMETHSRDTSPTDSCTSVNLPVPSFS